MAFPIQTSTFPSGGRPIGPAVLSTAAKHVPILQFFDIGTPETATKISLADFQSLITSLINKGYTAISLSDYTAWMAGTKQLSNRLSFVLTLWGGFAAQFNSAYPWLKSQNIKFNLLLPVSFIENEDTLVSGIFFGQSELTTMLNSGLAEAHSEGYHLKWLFHGTAASVVGIYTANGENLKWGGIEEFVEDAYSFSPLIGTNSASAAITSTYTFVARPRQYQNQSPAPSQIVAASLALDNLRVLGTTYSPTVTIKAKKHSDTAYTTIRASWTPDWTKTFAEIALDAPFTFVAGTTYDLQFITNTTRAGQGELVTLGSRTAGNPPMPKALWQAQTRYEVGAMVMNSLGSIEQVVTAGTSGTAAPAWTTQVGTTTNDYTVVWNLLGTPITAALATTCSSNSSAAGFTTGQQIGGDIFLLESLALETPDQTTGRVIVDALQAIALLVKWTGSKQPALAYGYPFDTYSGTGIFLPAQLVGLHSIQMFASNLLADRWSLLELPSYFGASATGLPPGSMTPVLAVDATKGLAAIENQIDSYSGLLWDVAPVWDGWNSFGWVNEFAADYDTERKKYSSTWSYLTSPRIRFNSDGVTLNTSDIAVVQAFLALPEILGVKVLARITNEADSTIAHNVFANSAASVAALQTLVSTTLPGLAGLAVDLEGAASTDRTIASSWITSLRTTRDANFAGQLLVAAVPAKTADAPTDPFSGWCDYTVWLVKPDYAAPLTYGFSDGSASAAPGPSSPLSWMQNVFSYASSIAAKTKLVVMMSFYGTWRVGGPNWSAPAFGDFYDSLKKARDVNATWTWDTTNSEWFWADAAVANKGYQPTPQAMKVRLDTFSGLGYVNFGAWALGQSDSLFYKFAEGSTPALAPYLKVPQGVEQTITQLEGQSSLGALEVDTIDGGGFMTAVAARGALEGKKLALKVGYPGMALADFVTVATQQVDTVNVLDDYTGFKITCRDLKRSAKQKVFLTGDDGLAISKDHPRALSVNPIDLALIVFQNELGLGQTSSIQTTWRIFDPAQWSGSSNPTLINPNPLLDVAQFTFYRNGIFSGYLFDFTLTQSVEAKQFLEYEVWKALGGWLQTNSLGQLTPRFFVPPYSFAGLFTFDDSNSVALPSMKRLPITNQVTYRMDHDGDKFLSEMNFVDAASVQQFDLQGEQIIESKGMRRGRGGSALAALTAFRTFQRFGGVDPATGIARGGAPVYTVKSFLMTLTVEVGDFVYLTHPLLPNLQAGTRGIFQRLCQVTKRQPHYDEGQMEYELLDVGWISTKSLSEIAPTGEPVWTAASAADRAQFAFLASSATNKFSDGASAKVIF